MLALRCKYFQQMSTIKGIGILFHMIKLERTNFVLTMKIVTLKGKIAPANIVEYYLNANILIQE